MSGTLFELTGEYLTLMEMAKETDDDSVFLNTIEGIQGEIEAKTDGYCAIIENLKSRSKMYREESKRLAEQADHYDNKIEMLMNALKTALEAMGKDSIEGKYNRIKIVKNGGMQPLKITGDVPDSFTKKTIVPDNEKIRKALSEGQNLDFAHLEERGTHLKVN